MVVSRYRKKKTGLVRYALARFVYGLGGAARLLSFFVKRFCPIIAFIELLIDAILSKILGESVAGGRWIARLCILRMMEA